MHQKTPIFFILAGESSGDFLGAKLMEALHKKAPQIRFIGIGGPLMAKQGLDSLFDMNELSLFGFTEVLPKIPHILKRLDELETLLRNQKPDMLITIDVPGFSKRLIKRAQKLGVPCVHYVAPTVWAYRENRAKTWAKLGAHLLTLFSFEPPYFEKHGGKATFVGHPLAENLPIFEKKKHKELCLIALPGSRLNEIKRHSALFKEALLKVYAKHKNLHVFIPTFEAFLPALKKLFEDVPFKITLGLQDEKDAFFKKADIALAASGTVTLELALHNIPMVVAYKVNAFTAFLIKRFIKIRHVALANILSDNPCVPELLQENFTSLSLEKTLLDLINCQDAQENQRKSFQSILPKIKNPYGLPSDIAAKTIVDLLK